MLGALPDAGDAGTCSHGLGVRGGGWGGADTRHMLVWVAGGLSGNVQEAALAGVGEVAFRCRGAHLGRSGARKLQAVGASAKTLGLVVWSAAGR